MSEAKKGPRKIKVASYSNVLSLKGLSSYDRAGATTSADYGLSSYSTISARNLQSGIRNRLKGALQSFRSALESEIMNDKIKPIGFDNSWGKDRGTGIVCAVWVEDGTWQLRSYSRDREQSNYLDTYSYKESYWIITCRCRTNRGRAVKGWERPLRVINKNVKCKNCGEQVPWSIRFAVKLFVNEFGGKP